MIKKSCLEILDTIELALKVSLHFYIINLDELFGKGIFGSWVMTGIIYGFLIYLSVNIAVKTMCPSGKDISSLGVAG